MKQVNKTGFMSLSLLITVTFFIEDSSTAGFTYENADSWVQINAQCGGRRQSPVSIDWINFGEFKVDSNDIMLLTNYDQIPLSVKLLNDGYSIKLEFVWDENQPPYIAGGVLGEDEYVLDSMHFHWSRNNSQGSEHILFGWSGALEMHLVHYNRNYGSVQNALNYNDGLAVIGGIFESNALLQLYDNNYENFPSEVFQESPAISKIINNLESVGTPGSSVDIEPFAISDVGPVHFYQSTFISYLGSLTTPPCTENVIWLLALYPYYISAEQLQFLKSTVELDYGDDHNYRPVQPMNGRTFSILMGAGASIN